MENSKKKIIKKIIIVFITFLCAVGITTCAAFAIIYVKNSQTIALVLKK